MSVTINAKGTSVSTFSIGKDGMSLSQSGTITPPDGNDLVISLADDKTLVIDAGTEGPALLTTTNDQDLHINPAVGGGQYLVLVANRWPTADGTAGQVLTTNGSGILSFSSVISTVGGTNGQLQYNSSGSLAGAPVTTDGTNLTVTGTRIFADFSNGTPSNRLTFQTSATNEITSIQALPSGTGNISAFVAFNNSDANNSSFTTIRTSSSASELVASKTGTGSFLPLVISTNGSNRLQVATDGTISVLSGNLAVTGAAATTRYTYFQTGGVNRWHVGAGAAAESGSNAGSNFNITAYTDAGTTAGTFALGINRVDSSVMMGGTLVENVRALGSVSGSTSVDLRNCNYIAMTIGGATTLTFTNPPLSGYAASWILEVTNGGSAAITWTGVTWISGSAPTLRASGINLVNIITRDGGTTYLGMLLA